MVNTAVDDNPAYLLIVLFLLSAFFSGSETAFFSLPRIYLKKLENSGNRSSKRILRLLLQPRRLLITILLGNTFVNMAISSLAALVALRIAETHGWQASSALTVQVVVTTLILVVFGEITPKLIALAMADKISQLSSLPLRLCSLLLFPLVWLLERLTRLISRRQYSDKHLAARLTAEELHNLIQSESSHHSLDEHEKKMLAGLFRFKDAKITEIYVPRVKVCAIEESQSVEELRDLIVSCGYSRLPVFRETIDNIVGIIYVKDLLLYPERRRLSELMRPVWFVTENMKVQTLLNQFKTKKLQMAVVVDEYGGTSGIISLEDILEEIVGEIRDEYDHEEQPELTRIDPDTCAVQGIYSIRQFNQEFGTELDPEEYDNIAEFLLSEFNHVPASGESYILDGSLEFRILDSDGKSIKMVQVRRMPDEI